MALPLELCAPARTAGQLCSSSDRVARACYKPRAHPVQHSRRKVVCRNKFSDDLLDYVTAGPKMRKWYGQGERLPRDGDDGDDQQQSNPEPAEEEDVGEKDAILVTDAETATGEQVILQLILARAKVKALVRDVVAAKEGFGSYVQPLSVDTGDQALVTRALRGVRAVVCLGKLGKLLPAAKASGVQHLVLLSAVGAASAGGLGALFASSSDNNLKDPAREDAVRACGIPYTIVRTGQIKDAPGGSYALSFSASASQGAGTISREDLACVLVQALQNRPQAQANLSLSFQVTSAGPGQPPKDWGEVFDKLMAVGGRS